MLQQFITEISYRIMIFPQCWSKHEITERFPYRNPGRFNWLKEFNLLLKDIGNMQRRSVTKRVGGIQEEDTITGEKIKRDKESKTRLFNPYRELHCQHATSSGTTSWAQQQQKQGGVHHFLAHEWPPLEQSQTHTVRCRSINVNVSY